MSTVTVVDTREFFPSAADAAQAGERGLSATARGLTGSEILRIAADIRAMQAEGKRICNLTVGDFSPSEFRIPEALERAVIRHLGAGQTNYPPSDGVIELRQELVRFYERELGLSYPIESFIIAGGARPIIYATYGAIVDPGEKVLYPTPSWNNNHYCHLFNARGVALDVGPETNFLPTAALLEPNLEGVRLIAINTPLNPTGTVMTRDEVRDIAQLVVDENRRRAKRGERSLFLMWDQVYWMLTFHEVHHHTPPELVPEAAAWTVFVDGISKAFAATGLRVGWTCAPPYVASRMRDILGHVGAWAPKPEQLATAEILRDSSAIETYHANMIREVMARLDLLHEGLGAMRAEGLPVTSIPPQGAIYLSARFDLLGRTYKGRTLHTNDDIRRVLLEDAGFGIVPFQAFGREGDDGWFRLSVGAVSPADIQEGLERVRAVLAGCAE